MTEHLVVGTDGSSGSAKALEYAAAEAARSGYVLEIVNALDLPTDVDYYGVRLAAPDIQAMQSYAEELLGSAQRSVHDTYPDLVCEARYEIGNATSILIEASKSAAAMVLGTRGMGAAGRAFLGSVSTKLALHAKCPLFVINEDNETPTQGPVVVGIDDSDFSLAALRFALLEAERRTTTLRVVTGYTLPSLAISMDAEVVDNLQSSERDAAQQLISAMVARVRKAAPITVEIEEIAVESPPADAILTQSSDAQLVVVGSHGKGWARRLFVGSVSQSVLHDATCPVAVINDKDA